MDLAVELQKATLLLSKSFLLRAERSFAVKTMTVSHWWDSGLDLAFQSEGPILLKEQTQSPNGAT